MPLEAVVGVAEAVPGEALAVPVVDLAVQGQRPLIAGQGLLVLAEHAAAPAGVADGIGLPGPVPGRPEQLERPEHVAQRRARAALEFLEHLAQVQQGVGLARPVTEPLVQAQGQPQVGVGVLAVTQAGQGTAEVAVDVGLPGQVAACPAAARAVAGRQPFLPVPAPVQVAAQGPAQLPGRAVEPGVGRQGDGRRAAPGARPEPGQRLRADRRAAPAHPVRRAAPGRAGPGPGYSSRRRPARCAGSGRAPGRVAACGLGSLSVRGRPARRRRRGAGRAGRTGPGACSAIRCAPVSSSRSRGLAGRAGSRPGSRRRRR